MTEQEAFLVLNAVQGLGNARIADLVAHYGSALPVLSLSERELLADRIVPPSVVSNIVGFPADAFLKEESDLMRRHDVWFAVAGDRRYPAILNEIPDAPLVLYGRGKWTGEQGGAAIALVGSRQASVYGMLTAEKFARELGELGIMVVSGLARGIDTASHQGCLKAGGTTLAVLGCGLSHVYPEENRKLFAEIIETGAVVSEFPMGVPPMAHNFPRRNRIISGLSLGVVVVEASRQSGALITSRFALEQGREVFAVPGPINHANAQGVNDLIRQGARLVGSVEDILEELKVPLRTQIRKEEAAEEGTKNSRPTLPENERSVYTHINAEPIHIDELTALCEDRVPETVNALLQLELKHLVRQLPGKYYQRVADE